MSKKSEKRTHKRKEQRGTPKRAGKRSAEQHLYGTKQEEKREMDDKLRGRVLHFFIQNPNRKVNIKQIATGIEWSGANTLLLETVLDEMVHQQILVQKERWKYTYTQRGQIVSGTFVRKSNGHNLLLPEDGAESIPVAERNSLHAMDGDKVLVELSAPRRGKAPEGEVVEILERKDAIFVGVLSVNNGVAFLLTESKKLANDIFVPERFLNNAKDGDKVVVQVVEWPEKAKNPLGKVLDVIGRAGDNTTEMHAILAEFGLPYIYPKEVEEVANAIDAASAYDAKWERKDLRDLPTCTIDPKTAKDFDDALSYRYLESKQLHEVGVHIADVTSYVQEGDIIDHEAEERATSVYLVDRTIPMLPERLCNDLCSLVPNEDRPAYSVIFQLSDTGEIKEYEICRSIIHSDARLAYEEAQAIIEGGTGPLQEEIRTLDRLAKQMRKARMENGAIDFERSELKFEIDETGRPIDVKMVASTDANKLIEEFMLLANRTVATHIASLAKPGAQPPTFVYRVHDLPDPDKLKDLATFVMKFGYRLRYTGTPRAVARSINKLLDSVQGKREENLVETVTIRTMAKAIYQTEDIGHYGLGFEHYTHFTSPIRRHPDMMVHRLLTLYLKHGKSTDQKRYEKMCEHDSKMEQKAAQAERASIKYKQVEYLEERLGEVFDGTISGVTEWGLYVELTQNGCEGLIPIRELDDDYYTFDEKNYCLVGFRSKKRYSLGDPITIRVAATNMERKQIDFELV